MTLTAAQHQPIADFSMLTKRQKLTIEHLRKIRGITKPIDIMQWCIDSMQNPKDNYKYRRLIKHTTGKVIQRKRRKHPKKYYQEIINHIAQGGEL